MNKKGFTGIEVAVIIAALGIVSYFALPNAGKAVNNIFSGNKNQQKEIHKVSEQYSMFYKDEKGNYKPARIPYKRTEYTMNLKNTEPPETLLQKVLGLGLWLLLIGVIITFLGAWPIVNIWRNKLKSAIAKKAEEMQGLEEETSLIVESIEAGLTILPADLKLKFLDELSKKQDSTTKELVGRLKHK